MAQTKTAKSIINPSQTYQYVDDGNPKQGGMKDVFFSPDKKYVVALYRDAQDHTSKERLKKIATQYYKSFFERDGGEFYENLYSWPTDVIESNGQTGIIVPFFNKDFFFKKGFANNDILKGVEKDGKWFASAKFRVKNSSSKLDPSELGDWLSYFQICVNIARGVKRLHAAGLAHSDLSYKNVLIDPLTKKAAIIDIDGLVVPGLFPPDVIGTADFIAPEVIATKSLPRDHPNRKLPRRETDLHALAVLIYMYLFYRHPLRGGNYFGVLDTQDEEDQLMGEKALFVEHPTDDSNRNFKREYGGNLEKFKPWTDLDALPYTIAGPYMKELFDQAFIEGLHKPDRRPPADSWEQALIKTNDLKLKCANGRCEQGWFIYNNTKKTFCPFCKTQYNSSIPVLDFYYKFKEDTWKPSNMRLVLYHNSTLHQWHSNRKVIRNERLTAPMKKPVGYVSLHNGKWLFVNQTLGDLKDVTEDKLIKIGSSVELTDGKKLLLSGKDDGHVAIVSLANT